MATTTIFYQKTDPNAMAPTRSATLAVGLDLYSCDSKVIEAQSRELVKIGIKLSIPADSYGRITARSGQSINRYIDIAAGVVDSDHTEELYVVMINSGKKPYCVAPGDRVAQLIVERVHRPKLVEVKEPGASDSSDDDMD